MARKGRRSNKRRHSGPGESVRSGFLERLSPNAQIGACLGSLLLVSLAFFWPLHFGGQSIESSDTTTYVAASEAMRAYEAETGRPALWAPSLFGGMPGYLIRYPLRVPQLDSVLSALRRFAWPTSHLLALFGGMFWLAWRLTRHRWASLLAAVAYGLTTYIPVILMAGHNTKFVSMCFAPWLLLAFHYAMKQPRPLAGLLFAAAAAANLRAGHIQITYYFLFILLIWWIAWGLRAGRTGEMRPFMLSTAWLVGGGLLGLAMSAQPYLATWEYKNFSIRGGASGDGVAGLGWERAMAWSQGRGELMTLLAADAYGGTTAYWGPKSFTGGPHYLGAPVIALGVWAAVASRRTSVVAFAIAAVLLTLFSLGENFAFLNRLMYEHFPLFSAFRAPETWLAAVACLAALLAAAGLAALSRRDRGEDRIDRKRWRRFVGVVALIGGFLVVVLVAGDSMFSFQKPGEFNMFVQQLAAREGISPDDPRVADAVRQFLAGARDERQAMFEQDVVRSIVTLLLTLGVLMLGRRRTIRHDVTAVLVVLIVLVDIFGVGRRYLGSDTLTDSSGAREVATYDFDRYIAERVVEAGGPGHFRTLSLESNPLTNARPSYTYESVGGYHAAKLRNYQEFADNFLFRSGVGSPDPAALALLGTRFVVGQTAPAGYAPVFESETGLLVFEREVDRHRLVGSVRVESDPDAMWEALRAADDPTSMAIVDEQLDADLAPIDSASAAAVSLEHYDARTIRWRVTTDAPRLFVSGEVYYPAGWYATIDGTPAEIHEVNGLFRGVVVSGGEHVVEMRFEPAVDRLGFVVSLAATVLVYGGVVLLLTVAYRRRSDEPVDEPHESERASRGSD